MIISRPTVYTYVFLSHSVLPGLHNFIQNLRIFATEDQYFSVDVLNECTLYHDSWIGFGNQPGNTVHCQLVTKVQPVLALDVYQ